MADISHAFFQIHEEDRKAIELHHASTSGGLTPEQLNAKPASYWASHCRRLVRPKSEIISRLDAIMDKYETIPDGLDSSSGQMLMSEDTLYVFAAVRSLVQNDNICGKSSVPPYFVDQLNECVKIFDTISNAIPYHLD